jgi:hypothetical protein
VNVSTAFVTNLEASKRVKPRNRALDRHQHRARFLLSSCRFVLRVHQDLVSLLGDGILQYDPHAVKTKQVACIMI